MVSPSLISVPSFGTKISAGPGASLVFLTVSVKFEYLIISISNISIEIFTKNIPKFSFRGVPFKIPVSSSERNDAFVSRLHGIYT